MKLSYDVAEEARKVLKAHGWADAEVDCPEVAADRLLSLIANQDGIISVRRGFELKKQEDNARQWLKIQELMGDKAVSPLDNIAPKTETGAVKKAQVALAELAQVTEGQRRQLQDAHAQIAHLQACNANLIERLRHLDAGEGLA